MRRLLVLSFISMALMTACGQEDDSARAEVASVKSDFRVVEIAGGLEHAWGLAFLPGGDFLVSERQGRLWRVTPDGHKTEISGVPDVFDQGQGGLLDVVLEPQFTHNGWVYFAYAGTDENGDANTEIARARLDLQQNTLRQVQVIFRAMPKVAGANHWGSRLLFAPDGTLYITLGERFDYRTRAQDVTSHLGTVVRILPDGTVPEDNPFMHQSDALPEIFSYGHRNIQGIVLHPDTQAVWIHEHGPKGGDEINILKAGANYGWPAVTFGINYWGTKISDKTSAPGMEDPIHQWTPSIAPSGMAFYTGDAFPQWRGHLFVGALAGQHLRRIKLEGTKVVEEEELLGERQERIRDVRQGPDGFLYVLSDAPEGTLLRLEPLD